MDAEARLVSRIAAGDMDAASELYDRHAGHVLALARRMLRDQGDAEDVVQDVFSQAWRTASRFEASRGTVIGWLLVMTRTRSIDRLRAKQARPDTRTDIAPDSMPSSSVAAPDQMLSDEQAVRVRQALADLPDVQRKALELAYYEGLTQSEIATRLTEPLGTIKTRVRTALGTLRERLRP
ncbi:MAG TPA: sigma-70 family RNA polymerase sigma factor [Vicinamibacterales bacterium]|nr:sigma-70 family RNA polymerase sigma factor [Vicinamibacterales bacterium]